MILHTSYQKRSRGAWQELILPLNMKSENEVYPMKMSLKRIDFTFKYEKWKRGIPDEDEIGGSKR
jgi:hypothetical protein